MSSTGAPAWREAERSQSAWLPAEGGTYLIGAALTGGDVLLMGSNAADLAPLLDKLAEVGAAVQITTEGIRVRAGGDLQAPAWPRKGRR